MGNVFDLVAMACLQKCREMVHHVHQHPISPDSRFQNLMIIYTTRLRAHFLVVVTMWSLKRVRIWKTNMIALWDCMFASNPIGIISFFPKKNIRTFAIHVHVPCFAANRNQKNQKMPLTCQNPARTDSWRIRHQTVLIACCYAGWSSKIMFQIWKWWNLWKCTVKKTRCVLEKMHGVSSWSPRIYPVICYDRFQWMIQLTVSPSLLHVCGPQNSRLKVARFVCFCLFFFILQNLWYVRILVRNMPAKNYTASDIHENTTPTKKQKSLLSSSFFGTAFYQTPYFAHIWYSQGLLGKCVFFH